MYLQLGRQPARSFFWQSSGSCSAYRLMLYQRNTTACDETIGKLSCTGAAAAAFAVAAVQWLEYFLAYCGALAFEVGTAATVNMLLYLGHACAQLHTSVSHLWLIRHVLHGSLSLILAINSAAAGRLCICSTSYTALHYTALHVPMHDCVLHVTTTTI